MVGLYVVAGVFFFIWVVGIVLFLRETGRREIQYRSWQMVVVSSVSSMAYVVYLCVVLEDYFAREDNDFGQYCTHFHWVHYFFAPALAITNTLRQYNLQFNFYWNKEKFREAYNTDHYYHRYKWTATPFWNLVQALAVGTAYVLPNVILFFVYPHPTNPTSPIDCFDAQIFLRLSQEIVWMFILLFMFKKIIQVKDPFGIKKEQEAIGVIGFFLFFFVTITSIYQYFNDSAFPKYFTPFYSNLVYAMCFFICIVWFPIIRIYLDNKKTESNFRHIDITLSTILNNPRLLEKFKEIAAQFWCPESLFFLIDASKYQQAIIGDRGILADEIVDKYIKVGALWEINIDSLTRKTIIFAVQERNFSDRLLDMAIKDVTAQLVDVVEKWKSSTDFSGQVKSALSREDSTSIVIPLKPIN